MFGNPFTELTQFMSPLVMRVYVVLMIVAVVAGTLYDTWHKSSAEFFERRRANARARAKRDLSGGEQMSVVLRTIGEAAVSGEFGWSKRRASHLLTMWGFILYVVSTLVMVFAYAGATRTPAIWPTLWILGAAMVLAGGLWFFLALRVNVAYDGDPPYHVGRADLFIGFLITSAGFALIWHGVQTATDNGAVVLTFFGLYVIFTTLLFITVPWSKFAHMFYKPVVAYQRKVEEADGSTDLPMPDRRHAARR